MKVGERAILRLRSDYAYGDSAQREIPAKATLDFDIELIDIKPKPVSVTIIHREGWCGLQRTVASAGLPNLLCRTAEEPPPGFIQSMCVRIGWVCLGGGCYSERP